MKIAVLLTCYNRIETTLRCLKRLIEQELPQDCHIDIFLVDDASPDQTGEKVKRWFPRCVENAGKFNLIVIRSPGNLYWCGGMRLAWDVADHSDLFDYYWWLNDDVVLTDQALQTMLRDARLLSDRAIVVGACSERFGEETVVSYGLCNREFQRICPAGRPQIGYEWLNGNCVLIPHCVYAKVGKIYGGYRHAYGDHDYGYMAMRAGFELYVSSFFVGACARQPSRYEHLSGKGVFGRIKLLSSPKGYNLHDAVIYKYRQKGALGALLTFLHVIVIVVFLPGRGVSK